MTTPFHIYLDLDVRNDDTDTKGLRHPPLRFEETRTQPFLDGDASEHFCTLARFTLQTGNSVPVFIPTIATSSVNVVMPPVNQPASAEVTIYKISF